MAAMAAMAAEDVEDVEAHRDEALDRLLGPQHGEGQG
jgi:hypothetical protein